MPAKNDLRQRFLLLVILLGLFLWPKNVLAANSTTCSVNSTCEVGEFLYDDNYAPITGATCTLTSKNPSGTIFLNNVPLTGNSDGWYSYLVNATGADLGLYRSNICCTSGDDYLCIDKSFSVVDTGLTATDVENAVLDANVIDHDAAGTIGEAIQQTGGGSSLTAADIWSYSDRSLTDFGSLVADIWSYSSRSLTTFGDLINSIWDNPTRTLTQNITSTTTNNTTNNITNNATPADITNLLEEIDRKVSENRQLLEEVARAPIIETTISEDITISLDSKIKDTKTTAESLHDQTLKLTASAQQLQKNWGSLSNSDASSLLKAMSESIGSSQTTTDKTLNADFKLLSTSWDNQLISDLGNTIKGITSTTDELYAKVDFYGKNSTNFQQLSLLLTHLSNLSNLIGNTIDSKLTPTLYGQIQYLSYVNDNFNQNEAKLNQLLSDWNKISTPNRQEQLQAIRNNFQDLNTIPQPQVLGATTNSDQQVGQRNETLNLLALIKINRQLLAGSPGNTVQNIWLEEGSIIFKSLITNPSRIISQDVPLKFYLPREVKEDGIIKLDDALSLNFDTERDAYYVQGNFTLAPGETKVFQIEVNDIWQLDLDEIESLRQQADQLLLPLRNTAYFGQGTTLKSDIDVALDKIVIQSDTAQTPESRIRLYRESQIELEGVRQKLDGMKTLVAAASSTGSIFGFVGGVQTLAVWGLIIILATGFVFLALYMRALRPQLPVAPINSPTTKKNKGTKLAQLFFTIMVSGSLSAVGTGIFLTTKQNAENIKPIAQNPSPSIAPKSDSNVPKPTQVPLAETKTNESSRSNVLGDEIKISYATLIVPRGAKVNLREEASSSASIIAKLTQEQAVTILDKQNDWYQIQLLINEDLATGWVSKTYIKEE